ncbi:hypothetical protein WB388_32520 [Streptomyces brasiliscabiei]|uniref:Nal1 C-terminal domain-containing protein n=1 Tax=Streptomyces brasiliscabiei TaxID=2736302 RepID=A0ABU8GGI8_9ACTN
MAGLASVKPRWDDDLLMAKAAAEQQLLVAHQVAGAPRLRTGRPMLQGLITDGVAEEDLLLAFAQKALGPGAEHKLSSFENIVGVGIREKLRDGRPAGEPSVAVYVIKKQPVEEIDAEAVVPEKINGILTDVVESGEFVAFSARTRHRPAPSGVSLGHFSGTTGTLGFAARPNGRNGDPGDVYIVGCNHVLACDNAAGMGDALLQPAAEDGGTPADDILGVLAGWEPLRFGWWFGWRRNQVDVAMVTVDTPAESVCPLAYGVGPIDRVVRPGDLGTNVFKVGRTSAITHGVVTDDEASAKLRHSNRRRALMVDQLIVESLDDGQPFSEEGDSGALVLEEGSQRPVGLVCGGTDEYAVVNRIEFVLDKLGVAFL